MIRVTKHIKNRRRERISPRMGGRKDNIYFAKVWKNGKNIDNFTGEFAEYLKKIENRKRNKNTKVKIYDNSIFIGSKRALITTYNVPERFLPLNKYLTKPKVKPISETKIVSIVLDREDEDGFRYLFGPLQLDILKEIVQNGLSKQIYSERIGLNENKIEKMKNKAMKKIKILMEQYENKKAYFKNNYKPTFNIFNSQGSVKNSLEKVLIAYKKNENK